MRAVCVLACDSFEKYAASAECAQIITTQLSDKSNFSFLIRMAMIYYESSKTLILQIAFGWGSQVHASHGGDDR